MGAVEAEPLPTPLHAHPRQLNDIFRLLIFVHAHGPMKIIGLFLFHGTSIRLALVSYLTTQTEEALNSTSSKI